MRTPTHFALALGLLAVTACNCQNPNIEADQPPVVELQSPANGATHRAGSALSLSATAVDPEDGPLSGTAVVWTSSLSGQLATGTSADVSLSEVGQHTLTVTATDSVGKTGGASVSITVISANAPNVAIVSPAAGATVARGELVDFRCEATTVGGQAIPDANIQWSSSLSGQLPPGAAMQASLDVTGADTITCTALDPANNESASASVVINVSQAQASSVQITRPDRNELWVKPGANAPFSNVVSFTATASDPNQAGGAGNLDGAIVWSIAPENVQIGTGATVQYTFGALGTFVVTAKATDSRAVTVADSITVHVVDNLPPQCEITRPGTDGRRYAQNFLNSFQGGCVDPESGTVLAPTWTATLEPGPLGTGFNIQAQLTVNGNQTLSACSVDPQDPLVQGCAHRAISVFTNTAPANCAITAPADMTTVNAGVPLPLTGSASDAEDPQDALRYRWTSNIDGTIGNGASTSTVDLVTSGSHTVTLTVTDPWGLSCSAVVTVTVNGAPQVSISSIAQPTRNCLSVTCEAQVDVSAAGTASDPQGIASHEWRSSISGVFGNAATATLGSPLPGKHMILFSATDSMGAVGTSARQITVLPAGKTQLISPLANTGNDVLAMYVRGSNDVLFVDGQSDALLGYTQANGVQTEAGLSDVGVALAHVGSGASQVMFVGLDGQGVERCVGASCTNYRGGLLALGDNVVNAIAASESPDVLLLGSDDGLVITRASDPSMGAGNGTVGGQRILGGFRIRAIALSPASTASALKAWIGTDRGLVELTLAIGAAFDPSTASATTVTYAEPKIPNDNVRAVAVNPQGTPYAGTDDGFSLDLNGATVNLVGAPYSFPTDTIQALLFERRSINGSPHDILWAGTPAGLIRYDLGLKLASRMTNSDGLPSNDVTSLAIGPMGEKYIGTATGLAVYDGP